MIEFLSDRKKLFENEYTWGKATSANKTLEFHEKFDNAIEKIKKEFGKEYPIIINGEKIFSEKNFAVRSPSNTELILGKFPIATQENITQAIKAAKDAFSDWGATSYEHRAQVFYECADNFSKKKFELAALMCFENGKNRIEAMGDVDEAIDFMRFYAYQLELHKGFSKETPHPNPKEKTRSVLKPYGVWGIIAPFNFPSAIAVGMTTGALITGNTTILKPSSDTPISPFYFVDAIFQKIPKGVINFVTGAGKVVGKSLIESPDVNGIAFTGSKEVGLAGFKKFSEKIPRPFISEMGGKNPVIVTALADLEKAAQGVMRGAFGYGGQKCSATSRAYVQKNVAHEFKKMLLEKAKEVKIGNPWEKNVFLGPVINKNARQKFSDAIDSAKKDGHILFGGSVLQDGDFKNGFFIEPTIITKLPSGHKLLKEELFLPILCVEEFENFEDAIKLANNSQYGLTAGIFSEDKNQVEEFFDKIEAGVVYANREASATTAALVGSQPFVGWKTSGTSGKGAGGENYLQQFMRSQTQTRCE